MDRDSAGEAGRLLAPFAVTVPAEAVWRQLLADPNVTTVDLQRMSGVSSVELSNLLRSLVNKQLVRDASTPTGVVAIDPSLALETHMARAEREMAKQAEAFAELRAHLPDLADSYESGRLDAGHQPGFSILTDRNEIEREIEMVVDRIRSDIRSLEHVPASSPNARDSPLQREILERGIRDRLITTPEVVANRSSHAVLERWGELGHETRTLPLVPTRLKIYDRDLAVLPVDPDHLHLGAIFIRVRSVVDLLCLQFDYMWSMATPVFAAAPDASAPSGRTARVLDLLLLGTTDERMARTLGVAVRTIRREIAELKTRLGVSSRTEIGAAAIRRGWMPSPEWPNASQREQGEPREEAAL